MRDVFKLPSTWLFIIVLLGILGVQLASAQTPSPPPRYVNLEIHSDPQLLTDAAREVVLPGDPAEFSISVYGTAPLVYTWYKDGNPLAGVDGAELSIPAADFGDVGTYWCEVVSPLGSTASSHVALELHDPAILIQPQSVRGSSIWLTCEAVGTPPISYRWLKDGVEVASGSNSIETFPYGDGLYECEVSGVDGPVLSNPASVITEFYSNRYEPGFLALGGTGVPGTFVAVTGGLEPVYTTIGPAGWWGSYGTFQVSIPMKPECINYLTVAAIDQTKAVTYVADYQVAVSDAFSPFTDAILGELTISAASPKHAPGQKADVAVSPYEAQQFVCIGTFNGGFGSMTADITAYVTWNTTQDAIVESGGLYVNTTPGPDAVITATSVDNSGTVFTSNALTVTDGPGAWWDGKGTTTNTIMGCVKDGSRSPKPPIGGATVGVYTSASSGSPVATMTSNSYGNYSRTQSKGVWCLKGSSGTHQLVTASNQSNQTTTLKGYFALWPTGTSIPPTAVLFSNSVIAKKSGSGKAGDPILLDENQIDIGAIASSPFADLTGVTLSVDGPGGYHTEIDILAEGSITTVLEPGDGTGEPGERGDYFADPNAMVRKPGGVYRGLHFLPAAGTYDFELTVTDSNGILATDNLIVERAADPEDEMPLAAWPLLPLLLALSAAAIAKKYPRR